MLIKNIYTVIRNNWPQDPITAPHRRRTHQPLIWLCLSDLQSCQRTALSGAGERSNHRTAPAFTFPLLPVTSFGFSVDGNFSACFFNFSAILSTLVFFCAEARCRRLQVARSVASVRPRPPRPHLAILARDLTSLQPCQVTVASYHDHWRNSLPRLRWSCSVTGGR